MNLLFVQSFDLVVEVAGGNQVFLCFDAALGDDVVEAVGEEGHDHVGLFDYVFHGVRSLHDIQVNWLDSRELVGQPLGLVLVLRSHDYVQILIPVQVFDQR